MAENCVDRQAKIHPGGFPEILPRWASYREP